MFSVLVGVGKMNTLGHVNKVFRCAEKIPFDNSSRIVLMSDCHRGDGSWTDDFSKNQNAYFAALTHYYKENYTYIEIGDGDELWKTGNFTEIIQMHIDTFELLMKFFKEDRLYFIYGNHDMVKKNQRYVKNNLYQYFNERNKKNISLFENIKIHEGLVLEHKDTKDEVLLIHGHQVDYINDKLWKLNRFLVRYIWKPLESFGVNNLTSPAKNYKKKDAVEKKLTKWVIREKHMLIAGHTHRPMFPEVGEPPYLNDGSCVHPRSVTGIEIAEGAIMLVKWSIKTKLDGTLFAGREILEGPRKLNDYFIYLNSMI
jgi:UDP-2,3-diacylglucosamine pyrophosphatase LpxH